MNIIGQKVKHNKYGTGTILDINDNKMQVEFKVAIKTFLYPDSFENYFSIADKEAEKYINTRLEEINKEKLIVREKKKEELRREYVSKLKISDHSQAVFGMVANDLNSILDTWRISTGTYTSGVNKGKPRVPKKLNMNSSCLLTMKPEGYTESDRIILGMCMVADDFIGANCESGVIPAHEKYRIIWGLEQEELLFWNYFSSTSKLQRWGNYEMKYVSNTVIKKILEDMIRLTSDMKNQENILEFYNYFCEMNHL